MKEYIRTPLLVATFLILAVPSLMMTVNRGAEGPAFLTRISAALSLSSEMLWTPVGVVLLAATCLAIIAYGAVGQVQQRQTQARVEAHMRRD